MRCGVLMIFDGYFHNNNHCTESQLPYHWFDLVYNRAVPPLSVTHSHVRTTPCCHVVRRNLGVSVSAFLCSVCWRFQLHTCLWMDCNQPAVRRGMLLTFPFSPPASLDTCAFVSATVSWTCTLSAVSVMFLSTVLAHRGESLILDFFIRQSVKQNLCTVEKSLLCVWIPTFSNALKLQHVAWCLEVQSVLKCLFS